MPCGGIYPVSGLIYPCWVCDKHNCELFCEEWDTAIHKKCVDKFLETDEGKLVLNHEHNIIFGVDL